MSPPDINKVAGKRIEAVTEVQLHENVCTQLVGASHPQAALREPSLGTRLQQKHFFVLLLMPKDTCVSSLFSLCPTEESCVDISIVQRISVVLETLPFTCESAQTYTRIIGQGTAFPANIPRQPLGLWLNSLTDPIRCLNLYKSTTCFAKAVITLKGYTFFQCPLTCRGKEFGRPRV